MNPQSNRFHQRHCALCSNPILPSNTSKEHVIPNAIGGRRKVEGFLCQTCNSWSGRHWDNELTQQLKQLCNLLGIKRERGKTPTIVVDTLDGVQFRRDAAGRMTTHRYEESVSEQDGRTTVNIRAPSVSDLKRHLPGLVRRFPQLKRVDLLSHAKASRTYPDYIMSLTLNVGGLQAGRSFVKSCVALAHEQGITLQELPQANRYLRCADEPCFGYYNVTDVVMNRPEKTFLHCVHIEGNERTRMITGYVEYFGFMRVIAQLSDAYSGQDFSRTYAIDPVKGDELNLQVILPDFTQNDIHDIYEYKKVDSTLWKDSLDLLIGSYVENSSSRERESAIDDAVTYALQHCGVKEGEHLTEKHVARLSDLIMERLTPYLLQMVK